MNHEFLDFRVGIQGRKAKHPDPQDAHRLTDGKPNLHQFRKFARNDVAPLDQHQHLVGVAIEAQITKRRRTVKPVSIHM